MNILPKKSWHVRNIDNIERVRRDEENARLEEEERERRRSLAEQEARTALLRGRASGKQLKDGVSQDNTVVFVKEKPQHLNFFADIEEGLRQGSNKEYEAEKKAEQEKREKSIGLLTYLGQSQRDSDDGKLWYVKSHQERMNLSEASESSVESKKKKLLDPLKDMDRYLVIKKLHSKDEDRKHQQKDKKHKEKQAKSKKKQMKNLEEMRKERLQREQEEHERERKLLASARGDSGTSIAGGKLQDDYTAYRYSSQYHPDLARKPRNHLRYDPY